MARRGIAAGHLVGKYRFWVCRSSLDLECGQSKRCGSALGPLHLEEGPRLRGGADGTSGDYRSIHPESNGHDGPVMKKPEPDSPARIVAECAGTMTPDRWEQINRLYYAALELETKERAQFLEESCQGDSETARGGGSTPGHARKGRMNSWTSPAIEAVARQVSEEPPSLVGRQLGPYQILGLLGSGGMGEVYKARDTRLNRTVAIKVIPKHLAERKDLRQRFEREARAIAGLNHPHICALHDIGSHEGVDFLVMEYLEGERLSERLKKGPLPLKQLLQVAMEITECPGAGPQAGGGSPRPEAGQHHADRGRGETARLRLGEADRWSGRSARAESQRRRAHCHQ